MSLGKKAADCQPVLADGQNFINRQDEAKRLSVNFEPGINTMIISPSGSGKSSRVEKSILLHSTNYIDVVENRKGFIAKIN